MYTKLNKITHRDQHSAERERERVQRRGEIQKIKRESIKKKIVKKNTGKNTFRIAYNK